MNIGFVGLTDFGWSTERDVGALQLGDHDPQVRGFTIPNAEIALDGAVDPYFKGFGNIVYKLDTNGETGVELEEAYVLTTSLPANLQLKAGQFFTEFGRQNPQHPHAWAFVDQPLVLNRMFGPDGLRSQGARLSWLLPTSFYTEAMVSVMNSAGGTTFSFRSDESAEIHGGVPDEREVERLQDFLLVPRIATSIDLTDTQTLLLGARPRSVPTTPGPAPAPGSTAPTSTGNGSPPRRRRASRSSRCRPKCSPAGTTRPSASRPTIPPSPCRRRGSATGGSTRSCCGVSSRAIVAGLRGDFASGNEAAFDSELRADRYRLSPNLTWYPTEFSKLRLQYNYDHREGIGRDHSLWLQFEFMLGAHAAHKF